MKFAAAVFLLISGAVWAAPATISEKVESVEKQLRTFDCPFLIQAYHPTDPKVSQLGFCLYPLSVTQGIFAQTACVGVLVEPDTGTRNAFYGRNGHWGIEGMCEKSAIRKKFEDPEIDKTVNPITSLRIKRQEGIKLKLLRDDFGIWDLFMKRTEPAQVAGKRK
ncbi:MAG: hypothetical protein V1495_02035 [Pseudomonadota bacterium]